MIGRDCKECLKSRLAISENGYIPICTLLEREALECISNNKCKFLGNDLYLRLKRDMVGGEE